MKKYSILMLAMLVVGLFSCKKDDEGSVELKSPNDLNEYVRKLPSFDQPTEDTEGESVEEQESDVEESETQRCAVSQMLLSSSNSEFFLLDPTTDVIYPGAMLDGNSVPTGEYTPILADRAPITISVSLPTVNQTSPVTTIENPKLSSVRTAVNNLLSTMEVGTTPAYMQLTREQTYSKSGLARSISVSFGDPTKALGGTVTFEEGEETTKVVIKFVQKYYTIDLDYPQRPSDWFLDSATLPTKEDLGNVSPVYVSSVTYGRMALITIESTESYDNIVGAINASMSVLPKGVLDGAGGVAEAAADAGEIKAEIEQKHSEVFSTFKMDMMVLGGSASAAANLITVGNSIDSYANALSTFINEGANWSPESPGVMLSYKLRHLSDNSIANIVLADRYTVRNCNRTKFIFNIRLQNFDVKIDEVNEAEVEGKVKGTIYDPYGNKVAEHVFWDRGETDMDVDALYTDFGTTHTFVYEHTATNEDGDISAQGYTLRLEGVGMYEVDNGRDDWFDSDDPLHADPVTIDLGNHDLLTAERSYQLKFTGDGNLYANFKVSAR